MKVNLIYDLSDCNNYRGLFLINNGNKAHFENSLQKKFQNMDLKIILLDQYHLDTVIKKKELVYFILSNLSKE